MQRRGNVIAPVESVSDLRQTDWTVEDGEVVWVRRERVWFIYRHPSSLAADGVNVVTSLYGKGNWERLNICAASVGQQVWFVSSAGDDAADGSTAATAIPEAERQRRWGSCARLFAPTTITYLDSPATTVNLYAECMPGASLTVRGIVTAAKSGVLTEVTVGDRNATIPWDVTAPELVAGDAGSLIALSGGPRVGSCARLVKSVTGTKHRTSPWGIAAVSGAPFTPTDPLVGDPYQVLALPTLSIGEVVVRRLSNEALTTNYVLFDSLVLAGGSRSGHFTSFNATCWFQQCILRKLILGGTGLGFYYVMGGADNMTFVPGAQSMLLGAGSIGSQLSVYPGGYLYLDRDTILQGAQLLLFPNALVECGVAAIFDVVAASRAVVVEERAIFRSRVVTAGTDLLWGTGNTGFGVRVKPAGALVYVTKPTINAGLGSGREVQIGLNDVLWGAVPFNDSGAGASGAIVSSGQ